jgi:hypothetical protein
LYYKSEIFRFHQHIMTFICLEDLPINHSVLHETLNSEYRRPNDKISYMAQKGELISLVKGYYALGNPKQRNLYLAYNTANTIYGASYISRYTALSYYGLLSDGIRTIESMTTKRPKVVTNKLGQFSYVHLSEKVFHIGIKSINVSPISTFLIASPEKALCDLIWTTKNITFSTYQDMIYFLEEDQRIDLSLFEHADREIFEECLEYGPRPRLIKHLVRLCKEYK